MRVLQDYNFTGFVDSIIKSDEFKRVCFYARCMKKLPHGGIININSPNTFLYYYPIQTFNYYMYNFQIPYFMREIVSYALNIFIQSNESLEDVLEYCFKDADSNWNYISCRVLKLKECYKPELSHYDLFCDCADGSKSFLECFDFEIDVLIFAFICKLMECKAPRILNISQLCNNEMLIENHNKYGLTEITGAIFKRQGFVFEDIYYLYSVFLDTSIGDLRSEMPLIAIILNRLMKNCRIFMRCDNNLAVPSDKIFSTASLDMQKFRGINLCFSNIETQVKNKEIIVNFDPETFHKVLLITKKDADDHGTFYHITVEQLWNPSVLRDDMVLTNLIHAKYYPAVKKFKHVDYEVIQYSSSTFIEKYNDTVTTTSIPIDKYGDDKYKVWCVEGDEIAVEDWSSLVNITLDAPFRKVFFEMFTKE